MNNKVLKYNELVSTDSVASIGPTYFRVAESLHYLMPNSTGFPATMLSNVEKKILIANAVLGQCLFENGDKVYIGMGTTSHIIFERMIKKGLIIDQELSVSVGGLSMLLSAQCQKIPCSVFGNYLVHEYASLTFTREFLNNEIANTNIEYAFISARGLSKFGQNFEIRTCKEEHGVVLKHVMDMATKSVVIGFDASKYECADGNVFLQIADGFNPYLKSGARLVFVSGIPSKQNEVGMRLYKQFSQTLEKAQYKFSKIGESVAVWNPRSPDEEKESDS